MRSALGTLLLIGLAAVAAAQPVRPVPPSGSVPPLPPIGLPLAHIGLPLPPTGLPLPPIGLLRPDTGLPRVTAPGYGNARTNRFVSGARRRRPSLLYMVPAYGVPFYEAPPAIETPAVNGSTAPASAPAAVGQLHLDITPTGGQQQLYVDGSYVGTFKDFSGAMELDAGRHAIDVEAPGFETLHLDVNISAGRSIAYRGTLTPTPAPTSAPAASGPASPVAPTTIYFIPGCYIGNVPPPDSGLSAGCDVRRLIITQP